MKSKWDRRTTYGGSLFHLMAQEVNAPHMKEQFIAKHTGCCSYCHDVIRVGDSAGYWRQRIYHTACGTQAQAEERDKQATADFDKVCAEHQRGCDC